MPQQQIAEELFDNYARNQAPRELAEQVEAHLDECEDCRDKLRGRWDDAPDDSPDDDGPPISVAPNSPAPLAARPLCGSLLDEGELFAGRYRLRQRLGKGSFGTVWEAVDESGPQRPALPERVAIKIVPVEKAVAFSVEEEFGRVSQLDHPNIVQVVARGRDDATASYYVVFAFVDGEPLSNRVKEGGLHYRQALRWMEQLASALAHAHDECGLYHLDLKPQNILIEKGSGRLVLLDFGVSVHRDAVSKNRGAGTLPYMSPEHLEGKQLSGQSDMWSLGVVFYELLTGQRPFETRAQVLAAGPPALRELNSDIPPAVANACMKCLARAPEDRCQTAAEFHEQIRRLLRPWRTRRAVLAVGAVAAMLALVAATVVYWIWWRTPVWREVDALPATIANRRWVRLRVRPDRPIDVMSTCRVQPGGRLRIEGRGTLRFAKDAGILAEGKVEVIGTGGAKVLTFRRLNAQEGWRGLQLKGEQAAGSRFSNLHIQGARGAPCITSYAKGPAIDFSPAAGKRVNRQGGAVIVAQTSDIRFADVVFAHNRAWRGGAALLIGAESVSFHGCRFEGNEASTPGERPGDVSAAGGAVFTQWVRELDFKDCRFENNSAADPFSCGGAVCVGYRSFASFRECEFRLNHAHNVGGAIYLLSRKATRPVEGKKPFCRINDCKFHNNGCGFFAKSKGKVRLHGLGKGAAVYLDDGVKLRIDSSRFIQDFPTDLVVASGGKKDNPSFLNVEDCKFRVGWDQPKLSRLCAALDEGQGGEADIVSKSIEIESTSPVEDDFLQHGFKSVTGPRVVDTVVLHLASALYWDKDQRKLGFDAAYREQFLRKHPGLRALRGRERTMHPKFVKETFEVFRVGPHYMIARDGRIFRLVREKDRAFHAGVSRLPKQFDLSGRENLNQVSIGVELIATHPDADPQVGRPVGCETPWEGEYPAYAYAQYHALRWLLADLSQRHKIRYVVGHDEIDVDPRRVNNRRRDPGKHFLWENIRDEQTAAPLP